MAPEVDDVVDPEVMKILRERGGSWACYRNQAMDSGNLGHRQYLRFGEGATHKDPPKAYPADTASGMGWRYQFEGVVDVATGKIVPQ